MQIKSTWQYLGDNENDDIPTEWVWERLRYHRDLLLAGCDFRMIPDAPWDRTPWEAYRQALRDLPANTVNPREAVWPEPPSE